MRQKRKPTKKKTFEWSKFFATAIAGLCGGFGIWATIRYYELVEKAITEQSGVVPDSAVPAAYITTVIAALMSYLLYQAGLKNSRNKYGIDSDGQPYRKKERDEDEQPPAEG